MRSSFGDVYLAQTLNKTLADYKAENIPLHDISFGAFPANKYKQSYVRDLLDVSGSFIQRQHIFYSDMSFNVSDLSAEQVIVNNDLSLNNGINIFQDSSLNSNVGIVGDASINGTLTIENNSIPESALNFAKPASNFGTFDSTQDVSMNSTFTLQGDYERFIDLSQNIQTDFSENIVMIPSSLGLDLSGGIATLSGKTGDQAFLNGTYIVKDNSGNTTGNIYDDLNENTAETPGTLSVVNNNKLTSLPKNWNTFQLQSGGGWLYDGSSNYTSYLDQYGLPQTVKGDNYDLTLPFHFYPSKAFLRTTPVLPTGTTNPDNYPASVKFLGASTSVVPLPTYSWDFRVDTSTSINDSIQNVTATYVGTTSTVENGLAYTGTTGHATLPAGINNGPGENSVEFYIKYTSALTNWDTIFSVYTNSNCLLYLSQYGTNGYLTVTNGDSGNTGTTQPQVTNISATAHLNEWLHIVATYEHTSGDDTCTGRFYANGSLVNTHTGLRKVNDTSTSASTGTGYIGSPVSDSQYNNTGYIRYFRLYNKMLSEEEVKILYSNRSRVDYFSTISRYHLLGEFDNKATTFIADSSANYPYNSVVYFPNLPTAVYAWDFRVATSTSVNDLVNNATATYYQTSSTVEDGLAYTGEGAHATIPSGILIGSGPSEISYEIYFKYTTALGNWDHIFDIQINSATRFRMTSDGDRGYFAILYGNANPSNGVGSNVDYYGNIKILNLSTSTLVDTWIHFIATIEYPSDYATNGTTVRFYHNGSLINTVTGARYNTGTAVSTTTDHIGTSGSANSVYDSNGYMRYLRWYKQKIIRR